MTTIEMEKRTKNRDCFFKNKKSLNLEISGTSYLISIDELVDLILLIEL